MPRDREGLSQGSSDGSSMGSDVESVTEVQGLGLRGRSEVWEEGDSQEGRQPLT